jgi:hypothetical protein
MTFSGRRKPDFRQAVGLGRFPELFAFGAMSTPVEETPMAASSLGND